MSLDTLEDAIIKSITVHCSPETAFRIWTERINTWWPEGHSLSGRSDIEVFIEEGVGGRYYERTADGAEYDWGEVLVWEPPHRLAYSWYLGSGPERPTRVEVTFMAEGGESTRVEVVHRGPELIGELWQQRKGGYQSSWQTVLSSYRLEVSMTKWEYCAIRAGIGSDVKKLKFFSPTPESEIRDIEDVHQTIAQLGEEGWEMVSLTQITEPDARVYYFKRPAG